MMRGLILKWLAPEVYDKACRYDELVNAYTWACRSSFEEGTRCAGSNWRDEWRKSVARDRLVKGGLIDESDGLK